MTHSKATRALEAEERNEQERTKEIQHSMTYHYLKEQDTTDEVAMEMEKQLENAVDKDDVAKDLVESDVESCSVTGEKMSSACTLSRKYVGFTWKQRVVIIFIFLHPEIGRRSHEVTCLLTGVKEQTLSAWLSQKRMIQMWVDLREDIMLK
jgi:hypothetical protein